MAMEMEEKMKLNRTLLRAIEILELLSRSKEGYTLTELSLIFDYPKSSVFDIIKTLVYKNMVVEDNQTGITKYKIGLASFLIGSSYLNNIDIVNIAKSNLIDFANKMNATTFMAVLDENMVTYIYKYEFTSVSSTLCINCTRLILRNNFSYNDSIHILFRYYNYYFS